jgi:hypothetical protein
MDSNELLKDGRILALKVIAEAHLVSKGNTKVDEIFKRDKESIDAGLAGGDIVVLHNWLVEEYRAMGLDLVKIIEAAGEKVEENKLSNYELRELIRRADILISQMAVIKKYTVK